MICGIITGPTYEDITQQIKQGKIYCQMFELRVDLWDDSWDLLKLLPIENDWILTCRKKNDGGAFKGTEESRLKLLLDLSIASPCYVDIEDEVPDHWVQVFKQKFSRIKIIRSFHEFRLNAERVMNLTQRFGDLFKLATFFDSADGFLEKRLKYSKIDLFMGLGEGSEFTRVLGRYLDVPFIYAPISDVINKGQVSAQDLVDLYGMNFSREISIYGLIGNPLSKSLGYLYHNQVFRKKSIEASYVNFPVSRDGLAKFIRLIHHRSQLKGLSVTSPLKEDILSYLDDISPDAREIGAVNTVLIEDGKWIGFNTDGAGAMTLLPELLGKTVSIIGAGGTAKAIAYKAFNQGARVSLFNRNVSKMESFAGRFGLSTGYLDQVNDCDVLINATSVGDPLETIPSCTIAFDVNYGLTPFLQKAKGSSIIKGDALFYAQAIKQQGLWGL